MGKLERTKERTRARAREREGEEEEREKGYILRVHCMPKKVMKKGLTYLGNPARPKDKAIEQEFSTTRIPFMRKHIQNLQDKVSALEAQLEKLTSEHLS